MSLFDLSEREIVCYFVDFGAMHDYYRDFPVHEEQMRAYREAWRQALASGKVRQPTDEEGMVILARGKSHLSGNGQRYCYRNRIDYKASEWDYLDIGMRTTP